MVKVELPPAVTALGLNVAVAPAGSPPALSVTVCAEPLTRAVVMVLVAPCPSSTVRVLGLALIEKSSEDRKSAVKGKGVDLGGRRIIKTKRMRESPRGG